ncbi:MAG: TFIIB-type zinc ribbon-containing protein [Candidatus Brockarchaeota archaeon]|nr:TFIIB-type zinc ribbon-containing protein [Candidatus Brockarchaeota archaeon]
MKPRAQWPAKCPQCGSDLVSAYDERSGLTWQVCPTGLERHYARLESAAGCPECGGRLVFADSELVCSACGMVVESDRYDRSLSYRPEALEGDAAMTELGRSHGDLAEVGMKNDLAGRPGTPDFDNRNLGTWTTNKQLRAALGLATRLNEKNQFEIILGEEERKAIAEHVKKGGKAAILPRSIWSPKRFDKDLVELGDEKLDPKKHLIVLGRERFEAYLKKRGGRMVPSVPRSLRGAKQRILRYEAVCRNRFCKKKFVTQDRRVKYCSKSCRKAEQATRHRGAQRDYVARRYGKGQEKGPKMGR